MRGDNDYTSGAWEWLKTNNLSLTNIAKENRYWFHSLYMISLLSLNSYRIISKLQVLVNMFCYGNTELLGQSGRNHMYVTKKQESIHITLN